MKLRIGLAAAVCAAFLSCSALGFADGIKVDYNHHADFGKYHTYSWGKVKVSDQLNADRIKRAVDADMQHAGWKEMPSGGQVTVMATDDIHNEKEAETYYDGMGGGWGMGWGMGWGGWGMGPGGGLGEESTNVTTVRSAHLVIDLFGSHSKQLLWRGVSRAELKNNPKVNREHLYEDIDHMFKNFPPKDKK